MLLSYVVLSNLETASCPVVKFQFTEDTGWKFHLFNVHSSADIQEGTILKRQMSSLKKNKDFVKAFYTYKKQTLLQLHVNFIWKAPHCFKMGRTVFIWVDLIFRFSYLFVFVSQLRSLSPMITC